MHYMKRILFWIFSITLYFFFLGSIASATTASFVDKDGRSFCETDSLDGSYRICTKEQSTGKDLINWEKYNPRLVETTVWKICVEDGKEVELSLCQVEVTPIIVPPTTIATGMVQTGAITATASAIAVPVAPEKPIEQPVPVVKIPVPVSPVVEVVPVDTGILERMSTVYSSCIASSGTMSCNKAIWKMTDAIMEMSTFMQIIIIIVFLVCSIFWFNMISHAFSNPVPGKVIWIALLLILSFPGAILYYFAGLRPYVAMVIASSPPRPPSFFY